MAMISVVKQNELSEAPSTPSIIREFAYRGEGILVIRSKTQPGIVSGWHHHGDYHVYGFMASGSIKFEFGPGGRDFVEVGPGGFFHVFPNTVHRDINPSDEEGQIVILFLIGKGDVVINVEGPDTE